MSERLTNILGYLTLFAILGAIWVLFGEDPSREQGGRGEPTFDGMTDEINAVSKVTFSRGDQTTTLIKVADGWTIEERNGFAADTDKVRRFLRGVALSKRREPKTSNPERFDQIGLGHNSLQVALTNESGENVLAFQMGDQSSITSDRSLTYIFQDADTRTWLVEGLSEGRADPSWWLVSKLLDVTTDRIQSVTLGNVVLARPRGETNYVLANLSDGEEAVASWRLSEPARVLAGLSIADVRHLGNPLSDPKSKAEFRTYDGLSVVLELYDMEGETWAQVIAMFDEAGQAEGAQGSLPAASEDGLAEATAINGRTRGWFFKLGAEDAKTLLQSRADFVIEATSPEDNP